jgi:uncharacterized protein YvpB
MRRLNLVTLIVLGSGVAAGSGGSAPPASASASAASSGRTVLLKGYPVLHQQESLTCEASSASMATKAVVREGQIMKVLPRSYDPNLGLRGNPNGSQGPGLVDYGVYAAPIAGALAHFGYTTQQLSEGVDADIRSAINDGDPMIIWVTDYLRVQTPYWQVQRNHGFVLVPGEHAILVVGYTPMGVIANDPARGERVHYLWDRVNRAWGYLGRLGLVVTPKKQ